MWNSLPEVPLTLPVQNVETGPEPPEHFLRQGVRYNNARVRGFSWPCRIRANVLRGIRAPCGGREVAMKAEQKAWLDRNAVTCRVFKGRWNIRHCLRMYNDIKDLKIQMSTRGGGKVRRHESAYNPCENCGVLSHYVDSAPDAENQFGQSIELPFKKAVGV